MSSVLGFLKLEKSHVFSNARPIVWAFIVTAFFGLVGSVEVVFIVFG